MAPLAAAAADSDNPAALAKLLSDALATVDDLRRQLADAERRAVKAERLLIQAYPSATPSSSSSSTPPKDPLALLAEADDRVAAAERAAGLSDARLRDAADAWASLERAMAATRAELARVLPSPAHASPALTDNINPHLNGPVPPLRTLTRVPTQIVTLPASPLTTGKHSFPSLPPPPVPNPRNVQQQQQQQHAPALSAQRSMPPLPTSSAAPPVAKKPRVEASLPNVKKPREERARFSESPPPPPAQQHQRLQPPPADAAPGGHRRDGSKGSISAFSSGSDEGRNKRKRGDEEDDELMDDDDDGSEMSLDEMILAVSGSQSSSSHAAAPPPQHHPTPSSSGLLNPNSGNHIQHGGRRKVPVSAAHVAPLYPAHNDQGQRQCRQCGQAGRYKDGKCVEKWGPGPAGPGTVCDRCRKKMKRVERRGYELVRDAPLPGTGSFGSVASTPSQSFSQSSSSSQATIVPPAQSQSFSQPPSAQQVHSPPHRTSTSPVLPTVSTFVPPAPQPAAPASTLAPAKEISSFGSSRRPSPAPIPRGDTLVDLRFNYEPPTSSVRSGWMKSEEVEPVS